MNRNLENGLWLGVGLQSAGLLIDLAYRLFAGVTTAQVSLPYTAGGLGVCLASVWHMRLRRRAGEEQRDRAAMEHSDTHSLFSMESETDTPFSATRQLHRYERFGLPAIPFFLALICGGGAVWLVLLAREAALVPPAGPLAAGYLGGRAFAVFLLHRVLLAVGRDPEGTPARAPAIWLGLTALASCFSAAVVLADAWSQTMLAAPALLAGAVVALLLAAEAFLMGIAGLYRSSTSRTRIAVSRLGALLCDPAAWAHSLAGAMDYQFGFRISETWLYRAIRRMILPLTALQLVLLLLSHCLVILEPHEEAVMEFLGTPSPERVLSSGYHLVLPPPFHRIRRYPVKRLQTLQTGFEHYENHGHDHHSQIKLWQEDHHDDEHDFLVAARDVSHGMEPFMIESAGQVPVNLLSISMSIDVQVTNLLHFMTAYRDPIELIRHAASRLLTMEAVNADVFDLMGPGQQALASRLQRRLQEIAGEFNTGLAVHSINLLGIHPPVDVAAAYEMVIGADEIYQTALLDGEAYRIRRLPAARAQAYERRLSPAGERDARLTTAAAEAELFVVRVTAAGIAPSVYSLRALLDALDRHAPRTHRRLIVGPTDAEVIEIDFTDKPYADLLNAAGRLDMPAAADHEEFYEP